MSTPARRPEDAGALRGARTTASLPNLSSYDTQIDSALREEFQRFLIPSRASPSASPRRQVFSQFVEQANKLLAQLRRDLNAAVLQRSDEMVQCETVLNRLRSFHRMDLRRVRKQAVILIALHRKEMKIQKLKTQGLQNCFEKVVLFIEFLHGLEQDGHNLPSVDIDAFRKSLDRLCPDTRGLQGVVRRLKFAATELHEPKPTGGNWYYNLIHPKSRTGKIIARFEQRIDELLYDDVYSIIEHLSATPDDFERVEDLLFDLGWQKKECPYGLLMKKALPLKAHLFPAAIGVADLDHRFQYTSFSELNGSDWPFKKPTDMLFEMLILPNPFDIVRCFWNVIQEVIGVLRGLRGDRPAGEQDIGFDAIFPILLICVLTFGVDEWLQAAFYAVSFSEHVSDDPQMQFAMTYLEGLITQMLAIDREAMERTAGELLARRHLSVGD
jgi:hypothetical protein